MQRVDVLSRLRDLDRRALNSMWGAAVVPYEWVKYRTGAMLGKRHDYRPPSAPGSSALGQGFMGVGRDEGVRLPRGATAIGFTVAAIVVAIPILILVFAF